jgi:AcrR family transcriptional regulator
MKASVKLSSEERREAIIQAVRRVFAEKGFHGTTTRELADAAGVSEALLFKHFPNKEALYSAMQLSCCKGANPATVERMKALEPSASTLVLLVNVMVSRMVQGCSTAEEDQEIMNRLMLRSILEDGEFARVFLQRVGSWWIPKLEACLKAAIEVGDAEAGPVTPSLQAWFAQHLAAMLMIHHMPATPIVPYRVAREKLVEQAVWFLLRGMGLKEEVLRRHGNRKALAMMEN